MASHKGPYTDLGLRNVVGEFYRVLGTKKSWATDVAWMNTKADQEIETYKFLGQNHAVREWKGGRLGQELDLYTIAIQSKVFENTLEMSLEDWRRDKTGQLAARAGELATRFITHWDSLVTTLITTNGTAYDGLSFFNTAHTIGASGTINNNVTSANVSQLNVTTAAAPTQTEMADAILGVINFLQGFNDEAGEPANDDAQKFSVMVPANLIGPARGAILGERLGGGNTSIIQSSGFDISLIPNTRLTSTTEFYVFRTDGAMAKPFILQETEPAVVTLLGPDSEFAYTHNRISVGAKAVRNAGYGDFLYAIKATLS